MQEMTSVTIRTSWMFEELLAGFGLKQFVRCNFLDKFSFTMSEFALLTVVAFACFNPVLAHFCFVFCFFGDTLLLLLRFWLVQPSTLGRLLLCDRHECLKEIILVVLLWSAGGWMFRILVHIVEILGVLICWSFEEWNWIALFIGKLLELLWVWTASAVSLMCGCIHRRHEELLWFHEILLIISFMVVVVVFGNHLRLRIVNARNWVVIRIIHHLLHHESCYLCESIFFLCGADNFWFFFIFKFFLGGKRYLWLFFFDFFHRSS